MAAGPVAAMDVAATESEPDVINLAGDASESEPDVINLAGDESDSESVRRPSTKSVGSGGGASLSCQQS